MFWMPSALFDVIRVEGTKQARMRIWHLHHRHALVAAGAGRPDRCPSETARLSCKSRDDERVQPLCCFRS